MVTKFAKDTYSSFKCRDCTYRDEDVLKTDTGLYYFSYCSVDISHMVIIYPDAMSCPKFEAKG